MSADRARWLDRLWHPGLGLFLAVPGYVGGTLVGAVVALALFGFDLDGEYAEADALVVNGFVAAGVASGFVVAYLLYRRRYSPRRSDERALQVDYSDRADDRVEP
ncbi:MAG TPA: hypothetical protein VM597_16805 [Gemmataceae bacterium]|nr:hypothetical protein [Gemmataceae bacterium]